MSFKIYPVIKTEPVCMDYSVRVNGIDVDLNTARVSAVPFNRRWPGHQRCINQSEPIQFLSMESDEPLHFEIIPKYEFDPTQLKIRPRSLGIIPTTTSDGHITFTLKKHAYFTVEAYGRNRALHVFVDPVETNRPNITEDDSNLIYFGAGEYDVGNIELHSGQTLYIDEGAVVYANIHATDADHIRICGRGILDNSRNKERILFEVNAENNDTAVDNEERIHTIQLEYCDHITIQGITIRDSLVYNIRPIACSNLAIKNVKIIGCWRYNSDGIDMHNCVGVHISDCFIRTFDDSICVKGFDCFYDGDVEQAVYNAMHHNGKVYDVFRDVIAENCVIWNDWGKCLEIGAETRAETIENIMFRNCDLIHLAGCALDCQNVDYADVNGVLFENIRVEADEIIPAPRIQTHDAEVYENTDADYIPTLINVGIDFHHEYSAGGTRRGRNRNINFHNIRLWGNHVPTVCCYGYDDDHKTENVIISGLYYNDTLLSMLDENHLLIGKHTENIRIETDRYASMAKNTVDSRNQLGKDPCVRFDAPDGTGPRVLFLGNSITLHSPCPAIGWFHEWGMAASSEGNDYVHLLKSAVRKLHPDAAFCICQAAKWESTYKTGSEMMHRYYEARDFGADIIIMRIIENCPGVEFDNEIFKRNLHELLTYLNPTGKAKVILTTGFWRHPGDSAILAYGKEQSMPVIVLGDLGDNDDMKAIGMFEHAGVANHPGDLGMESIAERIFEVLKLYL